MFCFIVYLIPFHLYIFLKQRKTEIRRNKLRHLLKPAHFIKYGRSKHVQNIIGTIKKYWNDAKPVSKIAKSFAMKIRDYLIANLVIANGLRSSNILNLRLRDFEECKSIEEYPGHKIITNDFHKTSSTYGEKFIAISIANFISSTYGRLWQMSSLWECFWLPLIKIKWHIQMLHLR